MRPSVHLLSLTLAMLFVISEGRRRANPSGEGLPMMASNLSVSEPNIDAEQIDKLVVPPKSWKHFDALYPRQAICPPNITSQIPSVASTQSPEGSLSSSTDGVASKAENNVMFTPAFCIGLQSVLVFSTLVLL